MDKYILEGSTGGYPYSLDEGEEPKIQCDLCGNDCTDNFKLVDITASLSICVCQECDNQDPVEYITVIEYLTLKHKKP